MLTKYETFLWDGGIQNIAGVDEVGRGALAGPLVTAAVILNKEHLYRNNDVSSEIMELYEQINDSKLLTPKKREKLSEFIREHAVTFSISQIENTEVDDLGISASTQKAFFNSIQNLKVKPGHVLTDTFEIKKLTKANQTNIIKGDTKSITIAAASIVAKVYRDALMVKMHETYQEYGFDKHKGYGTIFHMGALKKYGPCKIHRITFAPLSIKKNQ
ncbi:MAG: ribonuclease HII [Patescibacteria group bacterium]